MTFPFLCPKCKDKEISIVEQKTKIDNIIILNCECHICEYKFRFLYECTAYMDGWNEDEEDPGIF